MVESSNLQQVNPECLRENVGVVQVEGRSLKELFGPARDIYKFLTVECQLFLPPFPYSNHRWMDLIWANERKVSLYFAINHFILVPEKHKDHVS